MSRKCEERMVHVAATRNYDKYAKRRVYRVLIGDYTNVTVFVCARVVARCLFKFVDSVFSKGRLQRECMYRLQ